MTPILTDIDMYAPGKTFKIEPSSVRVQSSELPKIVENWYKIKCQNSNDLNVLVDDLMFDLIDSKRGSTSKIYSLVKPISPNGSYCSKGRKKVKYKGI